MKTRTRRRKDRLDLVALDTTRAGATITSCISRSPAVEWGGGAKEGAKPNIPAAVCIIHCNYPLTPDNHDPCIIIYSPSPLTLTRSTCPVSPVHRNQTNTRFTGPIFSKGSAATWQTVSSSHCTLEPRPKSSRNKATPRAKNSSIASDLATAATTHEVICTLGQRSEASIWPTVSTTSMSSASDSKATGEWSGQALARRRAAYLL